MSFAAILERLTSLDNPYPGLRPFDTEEAHLYFGRDQQILDLLDRMARNRFVAVLGLSGSGKSSLVRAGLIPALHQGRLLEPGLRWRVVISRPSGAPFAKLAEALGCKTENLRASSHGLVETAAGQLNEGEGLLLVIDQFEELFRYKYERDTSKSSASKHDAVASEAAAFISLLLASTRGSLPVYVVITMRTEYLGDCAEFPEFPEVLNESQYLVPRMTREQRRQAIEGPLGQVRISSGLVERILNDAGDEPDQLPMLQHALMRMWAHWKHVSGDSSREIREEDYKACGGVENALNRHADDLLETAVVRDHPEIVEIVFKRLTAHSNRNRERRDPALLFELWALCNAQSDERRKIVNDVIDKFRRREATFLAPSGGALTADTYIDISHESLIRNWRILADKWLPEEEKHVTILIELLDRARGWKDGKRALLTDLDLTLALEWNNQRNHAQEWAEYYAGTGAIKEVLEFLSASRKRLEESNRREEERRDRELRNEQQLREAAEQRAQSERKVARRTKSLAYILAGLLIAAIGLATWALLEKREARKQESVAQSRELAAQAEALIIQDKREQAEAIALRALLVWRTSEARQAAAHAFPQPLVELDGHSEHINSAMFSPDGKLVVTASADTTARVWNASTGQSTKLEGHFGSVFTAMFSPDGQRVVTASADHTARVWNAATGQVVETFPHSDPVYSAKYSPDGKRVMTVSADQAAQIWNAATGKVITRMEGVSKGTNSADFSPDGQRVVTATVDGTARVWDATTGKVIVKLVGHSGLINSIMFSPDGQRVVTASADGTARVWDARTGKVIVNLQGHSGIINSAMFSPDGKLVVTASADTTARVWNASTGQSTKLEGHFGSVFTAMFSPDGQRVVTASADHTARVWNAATGKVIAMLERHSGPVVTATFAPDGQRVVTAGLDHAAQVWNTGTTQVIVKLEGHSDTINSAMFSPDGRWVVTTSRDKTARVWDAATGRTIAKLEGHSDTVDTAMFSPDGQRVVTASDDNTARVWNASTGIVISKLEGHSNSVSSAMFSPDGKLVVTASADHTARVWNAVTGQVVGKLEGHSDLINGATFSPDGRRVLTASYDHTARVWNAASDKLVVKFEGHSDLIYSAMFSPDGQRVLTASADHTARLWDAATGKVIAKLEGHLTSINSANFSPDGQRVVTACADGTARVWDAPTGKVIVKLDGHFASINSAVFSPDGQQVVTTNGNDSVDNSLGNSVWVWDAATGQVLAKLEGLSGSIVTALFSPDGRRVVVVSDDHTAHVYTLESWQEFDRFIESQ